MKEFTKEMLEKLHAANNAVKGTSEYLKYHMLCDAKTNGRWHFLCWSIPYTTGTIKTVKDKTYIIVQYTVINESYPQRYEVSRAVRELLDI
jgi:hypothetical protein